MIIRSKAPLRIGFAGGGTDVVPYCDWYGGAVLNGTINRYAYTSITYESDKVRLWSQDINKKWEGEKGKILEIEEDDPFILAKGVHNRMVEFYNLTPMAFSLSTHVDAPPGSGLGASSILVVSIVKAFAELYEIPMMLKEIAEMAYRIERVDLNLSGGKQDQYASTYGGINYMQFNKDCTMIHPLQISDEIMNELSFNFLLYDTGTSRRSSKIINDQVNNIEDGDEQALKGMHNLKMQAEFFKNALLAGNLQGIGGLLDYGWQQKKLTAKGISSPMIDLIYSKAIEAGATGGKISGAGGGGFMMFYCPAFARYKVTEALKKYGGEFRRLSFTKEGVTSWKLRK